jgi:hypothetical protein
MNSIKNHCQEGRCLGWYYNPAPPEIQFKSSTAIPTHSVSVSDYGDTLRNVGYLLWVDEAKTTKVWTRRKGSYERMKNLPIV